MTTSATGKRAMRRTRRAFTLLELLLVLALAAMMLAVALPSLNRSLDTQRIKRGADLVRTHLLRARTKAMTSGEIFSFRFQIDSNLFRVEQQSNLSGELESAGMAVSANTGATGGSSAGASAPSASSAGAKPGAAAANMAPPIDQELPEGVKFQSGEIIADPRAGSVTINDRRAASILDAAWSQPILFFPDGTATNAKIIVLGEGGRSITVELRSLTGGVKVGEVSRTGERK